MIHQPSWGSFKGKPTDIEITAREILKLKDELYQIICQTFSGQTNRKGQCKDSDRDYWMKAQMRLSIIWDG
jgi:ATP-dependent Clp protease protease subunit